MCKTLKNITKNKCNYNSSKRCFWKILTTLSRSLLCNSALLCVSPCLFLLVQIWKFSKLVALCRRAENRLVTAAELESTESKCFRWLSLTHLCTTTNHDPSLHSAQTFSRGSLTRHITVELHSRTPGLFSLHSCHNLYVPRGGERCAWTHGKETQCTSWKLPGGEESTFPLVSLKVISSERFV